MQPDLFENLGGILPAASFEVTFVTKVLSGFGGLRRSLRIDFFTLNTQEYTMKIVQVTPKVGIDTKLKTLLKNTERQLRGPHTTFEREKEGRWKHVKYPGWIHWDDAAGGLLVAEIRTKVKDHEWQILEAFIGYLDRHLGEQIESIVIHYR